ncbi:MAG: prepilin peptidase [Candidatus Thorarchaeota archaeon]
MVECVFSVVVVRSLNVYFADFPVMFLVMLLLLSAYAWLDLKTRRVSNRSILIGGAIGLSLAIVTGPPVDSLMLHLVSLIVVSITSLLLWQVGAIGGADLKVIFLTSILSPGLEFAQLDALLEIILGDLLRILTMLVLGILYQQMQRHRGASAQNIVPLIPLFLVAYVLSQFAVLTVRMVNGLAP